MNIARREFLKSAGCGCAGVTAGLILAREASAMTSDAYVKLDLSAQTDLADTAIRIARKAGASYADIRIGRDQSEFAFAREDRLQAHNSSFSAGFGVP